MQKQFTAGLSEFGGVCAFFEFVTRAGSVQVTWIKHERGRQGIDFDRHDFSTSRGSLGRDRTAPCFGIYACFACCRGAQRQPHVRLSNTTLIGLGSLVCVGGVCRVEAWAKMCALVTHHCWFLGTCRSQDATPVIPREPHKHRTLHSFLDPRGPKTWCI